MAEVLLSPLLQRILESLTSSALQELGIAWGLRTELEKLKSTLSTIQAVLADAEAKQWKSEAVKDWLRKLKDSAYDADDVLAELDMEARKRKLDSQRGAIHQVSASFSVPKRLIFRLKMGHKIKDVQERLDQIAGERSFHLTPKEELLKPEEDRETDSLVGESEIIGRNDEKEMLIGMLLDGFGDGVGISGESLGYAKDTMPVVSWANPNRWIVFWVALICRAVALLFFLFSRIPNLEGHDARPSKTKLDGHDPKGVTVYAIWGMGGIGKTTLAKLVNKDKRVQGHFDLKLWVCVSNDFDLKRITGDILESIEESKCNISNLDPLQRRLQKNLTGKRYLLVLDDVWNENHGKWDRLKDVLMCGAVGSKIIVTTRSQKVADMMATRMFSVHHMVGLSVDDSWSLFKQRAFGNRRMEENHELFEIGKAIVKKCGGLPLAIKALGSLMQLKSSESEWLSVKDSEIWDLPDDGSTILPALRLGYDNLPSHSRQCFAYCCIFPKDTRMEKDTLIELWMANGFIPSKGGITLRDMGHRIFNHLVSTSFLQDVEEDYWGEVVCKMHDLMHDLALSIMQYELYVMDQHKDLKAPGKVRHLLFNIPSARGLLLNEAMLEVPSLRSFVPHPYHSFSWEQASRWISKQKYLRVLDLSYCDAFGKVPKTISNYNYLRYLNMSYTDIEYVPESVCDLQNLEILKLKECYNLCKLPKRMKNMRNLIYVDIKGCESLISMPPKLGQLPSLRRLSIFIVGQDEGYRVGELKDLNLGGELSIKKLDNVRSSVGAKSANLKRKHDLVSLGLHWSDHKEENLTNHVEQVLENLQPHSNLKKLSINYYRGSKFPNWMMGSVLKNLVEVSLKSCSQCEHIPPLGKLYSLKNLDITEMDSVKFFDLEHYRDGEISFQALETLRLGNMPSLEEWTKMDRQYIFPCLQELGIKSCPKLTNLPALPTLERLEIGDNEMLVKSVNILTSISSLKISNFQGEILPDGLFQNHEALQSLDLECMPNLETLKGLEGLTSLRSLAVHGCDKLRLLSEGMQHLTVLKELLINECPKIQSFPDGLRHLTSLQSLTIGDCEGLFSLPNWLGCLQSLSSLDICGCSNLRSMPDGLGDLRELRIVDNQNLERRCKKGSGEDWPKIAHIPIIEINNVQVQSLDE